MMQRLILPLLAASGLVLASCSSDPDTAATRAPEVPGMIIHASESDVGTTVEAVQDALTDAGKVASTIDHSAAAQAAGLSLDPTTLIIGGNPEVGTPIMQAEQEAAIDLPQKYLVWEDDGQVWLGYNSADYIGQRADLDADDPSLDGLREGSAQIAATASGTDEPVSTGADPVDDYVQTEDVAGGADVETVVERLVAGFAAAGLGNPATVDHAAGADSIGEDLRPTSVTYGGDPAAGTPLMQEAQTIGIDLPLRFVVFTDDDGEIEIGYPDYEDIAERHGLPADATDGLAQAAEMFAGQAASGS